MLCVDCACRVVLAGWKELSRCLGQWPTVLEQLQMGQPGACNDALLIMPAPFVQAEMGSGNVSRNTLQRSCRQASTPGQRLLRLATYEGGEGM